jgi:DNA-binding HxlR family transcriptional regulator
MEEQKHPIIDFLTKKGGFDLLLKLKEKKAMKFGEVQEALNLSPTTALERLREASKLGIIEEKLFKENGSEIKYVLTKGKDILNVTTHMQKEYLKLREEIIRLEKEKLEKEREVEALLSSLQENEAVKSVSKSILKPKGK